MIYLLCTCDYDEVNFLFASSDLEKVEEIKQKYELRMMTLEKVASEIHEKMLEWEKSHPIYSFVDYYKWSDAKYDYYEPLCDEAIVKYKIKPIDAFYELYTQKTIVIREIPSNEKEMDEVR